MTLEEITFKIFLKRMSTQHVTDASMPGFVSKILATMFKQVYGETLSIRGKEINIIMDGIEPVESYMHFADARSRLQQYIAEGNDNMRIETVVVS
jgi:hypothetical protein